MGRSKEDVELGELKSREIGIVRIVVSLIFSYQCVFISVYGMLAARNGVY